MSDQCQDVLVGAVIMDIVEDAAAGDRRPAGDTRGRIEPLTSVTVALAGDRVAIRSLERNQRRRYKVDTKEIVMTNETLRRAAKWVYARWADKCDECHNPIRVKQKMLWFTGSPHSKLCESCGRAFRRAQHNGLGELEF